MWRQYPTELRADLQRYYGVCLDDVGHSVSPTHAAALAACLPHGSATLAAIDPSTAWSDTEWLLLAIVNMLSKEPVNPFERSEARTALDVDEYEKALTLKRKEVKRDGYGVG